MKFISTFSLVILLFLSSCDNEDFTVTEEVFPASKLVSIIEVEGIVFEEFSNYYFTIGRQMLNNVSVRLMHNGVTLDETNTDQSGRFLFPEQPVPIDEAYLILEAPGFHKNAVKIDSVASPDHNFFNFAMIRETFDGLSGDGITDEGPYINLTAGPPDRDFITPVVYYITNSNNELIGVSRQFVELEYFHITTLVNEPLFLHYLTECSDQIMEIGPFSEDTDISEVIEGFSFDSKNFQSARTKAYDCSGAELPVETYDKFITVDNFSRWSANNSNISSFGAKDCVLAKDPSILVSIATDNPRRYGEATSIGGQEDLEITICEDDDTYLNFSIGGGAEVVPDLFTYANILPNGNLLLKIKDPIFPGGTDIAFEILDASPGSSTSGGVLFNLRTPESIEVTTVGSAIDVTISVNDGSFIEGVFDGPVFDAFESPLGNLSGAFRARILQ